MIRCPKCGGEAINESFHATGECNVYQCNKRHEHMHYRCLNCGYISSKPPLDAKRREKA